jgi:type I restriction enzyme S subunit
MCISDDGALGGTIVLPGKEEQSKICDLLAVLDSRIAAQRKLVELLKKHKRGLSSVLFSGKVRIATNAKWKIYRLGDIVRRVTRKNGKATDIPLTISAQHGLIDQREFFSKAVASADMSGYYLLKQGEFAYNRSSSGEYPFGSIKKLERYHQGAVSTLYICFETLGDKDDAEFLKWYFDSFAWHREIGMICAEGARNHGLLNVPTDGFFDTKHILPSDKDERKKIASLMALADARCECAETELDRLTAIKSGLLQQMFV